MIERRAPALEDARTQPILERLAEKVDTAVERTKDAAAIGLQCRLCIMTLPALDMYRHEFNADLTCKSCLIKLWCGPPLMAPTMRRRDG